MAKDCENKKPTPWNVSKAPSKLFSQNGDQGILKYSSGSREKAYLKLEKRSQIIYIRQFVYFNFNSFLSSLPIFSQMLKSFWPSAISTNCQCIFVSFGRRANMALFHFHFLGSFFGERVCRWGFYTKIEQTTIFFLSTVVRKCNSRINFSTSTRIRHPVNINVR